MLADVDTRAGVGKAAASAWSMASEVTPETLERVNRVIRELGFSPAKLPMSKRKQQDCARSW